MKGWIRKNNPC